MPSSKSPLDGNDRLGGRALPAHAVCFVVDQIFSVDSERVKTFGYDVTFANRVFSLAQQILSAVVECHSVVAA